MDTKDDLHAFVVVAFLQTARAYFSNNVHIRLPRPWACIKSPARGG
jgi:hypothetical protein